MTNPAHNVSVNNSNVGKYLEKPKFRHLFQLVVSYIRQPPMPQIRSFIPSRPLDIYRFRRHNVHGLHLFLSITGEHLPDTLSKYGNVGSKEVVLFQLSVKETTNSSSCLGHGTPTKYAVPYRHLAAIRESPMCFTGRGVRCHNNLISIIGTHVQKLLLIARHVVRASGVDNPVIQMGETFTRASFS